MPSQWFLDKLNAPVLKVWPTPENSTDILVFKYNGAVWQEVGRTLNLSES